MVGAGVGSSRAIGASLFAGWSGSDVTNHGFSVLMSHSSLCHMPACISVTWNILQLIVVISAIPFVCCVFCPMAYFVVTSPHVWRGSTTSSALNGAPIYSVNKHEAIWLLRNGPTKRTWLKDKLSLWRFRHL